MNSFSHASKMGLRILRDMPSNSDNIAHAWLLRGGYLYQQAAGIYCFTPMIYRIEQKVSAIIAKEITLEGGAQLRLPILQSGDLWKQTGRWEVYAHDRLMFQFEDRRGREFGLSPTAEEAVCDLVKHLAVSASQLPLILFQQNMKFRDELRPRSGLLRSREFIMMDAYSFDIDEAGLDEAYRRMRRAYHAIFSTVGLRYISVEADSGAIGGTSSEEFMSISSNGEDTILYNDGYAANLERAVSVPSEAVRLPDGEIAIVDTPDTTTIKKLADFLDVSQSAILKTLVFQLAFADRLEHVAVFIRGDCSVNDIKLANHFGALKATSADAESVQRLTGTEVGYVGPIGLSDQLRVVADNSLEGLSSLVTGCGQANRHAVHVRPGRDFVMPEFVDLRSAEAGEIGPNGAPLEQCRGIEVGHIFKLGDKYSKSLDAGVVDSSQTFRTFQMGCYGIGTTRLIAAIADQSCDEEKGIVWPLIVAPFHVHIIPLKAELLAEAETLALQLAEHGVECLVDDRGGSVGSLLKDSDIIGLPLRISLGRDFQHGKVEFLNRLTGQKDLLDTDTVLSVLGHIVEQEVQAASTRKSAAIRR